MTYLIIYTFTMYFLIKLQTWMDGFGRVHDDWSPWLRVHVIIFELFGMKLWNDLASNEMTI